MSEDEAINILKTMCTDNFCIEQLKSKQAIETILDLYKQEKEKNSKLQKRNDRQFRLLRKKDKEIQKIKDKIKEKMKIIENECKTCKYNHLLCEERKPLSDNIKYCLKLECYDVLKSLLEEN